METFFNNVHVWLMTIFLRTFRLFLNEPVIFCILLSQKNVPLTREIRYTQTEGMFPFLSYMIQVSFITIQIHNKY
jgi:hypothetical protein